MRILLVLIISGALCASCMGQTTKNSLNKEVLVQGKPPILLGQINEEGLRSSNYNGWFTNQYDSYEPKPEVIDQISKNINAYTMLVFMGTWCGDSRRETPRFYKVLDKAKFSMNRLKVVAVNSSSEMYKQSPNHEEKGLNIHRVPTFIIYKNGEEVNRIVESPKMSFEEDIAQIINDNYTSKYHVVDQIHKNFDSRNFEKSLAKWKQEVKSIYELNTYARVLVSQKKEEDALVIFQLNTELFPDKAETHIALAAALAKQGRKHEAIGSYEKALDLNPLNKRILNNIAYLKKED